MYQKLLKEGNDDQRYLRYTDLLNNNFEFLRSVISMNKIDLECSKNVNTKLTGNDSDFIT